MVEQTGRSLALTEEQRTNANIALSKFGSKRALAAELKMSPTTITNFFAGRPVQRKEFHAICKKLKLNWQPEPTKSPYAKFVNFDSNIDKLVRDVRSRIQNDIQCLHGMMPLWGVDHWVLLSELFVDVNILAEVNSSRRAELDDLWQDFSRNPSYRSLDRIGLGKEQKRMSGLQVLERGTNLMVLGKPGSGKTTFLQRIVTECNTGKLQPQRIPVLIKLRDFVDDGEPFQYSLESYLSCSWNISYPDVKVIFDQGRSLILLDGLDEITGEKGKKIVKQVKQFARMYPHNQFIVTCRTQSQESRFERFDYIEVADFNVSQVEAFSEHWFTAILGDDSVGLKKAQEFLEYLFQEANEAIRELATTPILLSLTCAVFHQTGKLYSKKSRLYEEGLELLLEKWDKTREIERDETYHRLSIDRKLDLLSNLAVKKFEQTQYVLFDQKELEAYIADFLKINQCESQAVLRSIELQHGLLVKRAQKVWSFSHLTFQEYFVARQIESSNYEALQKLASHVTNKSWREVLLLVLEMLHCADDLIKLMKIETDRILENDEQVQKFLEWIDKKSNSVSSPYILAAVRAFYFRFNRMDILDYDFDCDNLENEIDSFLAKDLQGSLERECHLSQELALDQAFDNVLGIAEWYIRESTTNEIDDAFDFLRFCAREKDAELKLELSNLQEWLWSFRTNSYDFEQAWKINGNNWTEKLRLLMIKHRNIGHDWQFSDAQKELLRNYYLANKLLIKCLRYGCHISINLQKEVKETLLLPITEMEKRKSNG